MSSYYCYTYSTNTQSGTEDTGNLCSCTKCIDPRGPAAENLLPVAPGILGQWSAARRNTQVKNLSLLSPPLLA